MAQVSVATPGTRQSVSLYVGNLAPDVTEANLMETFSQVGAVASIRVCRDFFTRRSLGYAYVNYLNPADAERALDALNYVVIKDRSCRIMWSQRDPSVRKSGQGNIFIKDLHKSIDNKSLHDTFSAFGNILSCRLMTDEHGHSRGFGFVHFESAEAAEMAIQKVNGMLMEDKKVYVGPYLSRKERTPRFDELQKTFTNVFVKNLDPKVSREDLMNMFKNFGNITSAIVMTDPSGKSKGFGFVNFSDHSSAEKACESLNESELHGKKLYVGRAQKADERRQKLQREYEVRPEKINRYFGSNLYVKNLEDSIDEEKLKQAFKEFGTITSCRIMVDERGNQKGYGFVCFSAPEEAYRALSDMNGKIIATKPLYVNIFQTKMQRRQFLENNYLSRMYPHQLPMWPMPNGMQVPSSRNHQYSSYYRPSFISPQSDMMPYNSSLNRGPRAPNSRGSNPRLQGRMDQKPKTRPNPYESGYEYSPEQTQIFGNKIYNVLVQNSYTPDAASKITGMLLQMNVAELAQVSDSQEDILNRAGECIKLIH